MSSDHKIGSTVKQDSFVLYVVAMSILYPFFQRKSVVVGQVAALVVKGY